MDLKLNPVQERLAGAVELALTRTGDPRAELAGIGVPAVSLSPRWGGLGLGLGADVIVGTELGTAMETLPGYRETALCLDLLQEEAPREVEDALAAAVDGKALATTLGLHAPVTLRCDGEGRLWGVGEAVEACPWDVVVARAAVEGGAHRWFVLPVREATCGTEPAEVLGTPAVRLHFSGARAHELDLNPAVLGRALDAARVRQAALLLGLATGALRVAKEHVNRRLQFGRPLVEFQTVSHRLAALMAEGDGWLLLLHEAAWLHDREEDTTVAAAQVLAAAADHALRATRLNLQLHGARGMLSGSRAASAYRTASVEAVRLGPAERLWPEIGRARLAALGSASR
ncbi:alkylation response protein AidB-like acyl-CoA dehydrogenase [Streptosporangium becharense]|nr:acyl-CoA dehydrogenase family protein [Streptosporangium becharense]MBB2910390.1 alkylation response protein AidB-like acyl-CoA dehydrogenase [Streptosporangium becharense]